MDEVVNFPRDEAGIYITHYKFVQVDQPTQKACICFDWPHFSAVNAVAQLVNGVLARLAPGDQLGDHRVVIRRNFSALFNACVDPKLFGKFQMIKGPNRRQKTSCRIFRIEPRFHRPTVDAQLLLLQGKSFTAGDAQLPFDQIDSSDFLGHRMFDLQPCVHFHEPYAVGAQSFRRIGNKLDGARTDIIDCSCCLDGCGAQLFTGCVVHARRRGFFDYLLVTTLQ